MLHPPSPVHGQPSRPRSIERCPLAAYATKHGYHARKRGDAAQEVPLPCNHRTGGVEPKKLFADQLPGGHQGSV